MKREIVYISIIVLILSMYAQYSTLAGSGYYYVQTNSPQYSILPDSIFVQSLPSNYTLPFAVLLNFTNYGSLMKYTYSIVGKSSQYISPSSFREKYYPSNSYINSLVKYLKTYGVNYPALTGVASCFKAEACQR